MYKFKGYGKTLVTGLETVEGERLETKIERILQNKEPIKDGAPEIFTARKDGVQAGFNIRSDRWEIAADAMDKVTKSKLAQRDARHNPEMRVVKDGDGDGKAESTAGKNEAK